MNIQRNGRRRMSIRKMVSDLVDTAYECGYAFDRCTEKEVAENERLLNVAKKSVVLQVYKLIRDARAK